MFGKNKPTRTPAQVKVSERKMVTPSTGAGRKTVNQIKKDGEPKTGEKKCWFSSLFGR